MSSKHNAFFIARNLWSDPMERAIQQALDSQRFLSEAQNPWRIDPQVDAALTGAITLRQQVDLCLPDPLPFVASRHYSSQAPADMPVGLLGPGWRLAHEAALFLADDAFTLQSDAAEPIRLQPLAPGEMTYSRAHRLWVVRGGSEHLETRSNHPAAALRVLWRSLHAHDKRRENFFFVAHHALGPWWIFGPQRDQPLAPGQRLPLRVIRDRFGRMLQFGHDPHTGLTTIAQDSSGRQFRLELKYFPQLARKSSKDRGADHGWRMLGIHVLKDAFIEEEHPLKPHQPPVVRYEYTSRGELAGIYGRGETLLQHFEYDEHHAGRITRHARAARAEVSYGYDEQGRVSTRHAEGGLSHHWQYESTDPLANKSTTITDSMGRKSSLQCALTEDGQHRNMRYKRADGSSISQQLDRHGCVLSSTDGLGRTTHYERDELTGLLLGVRDSSGQEHRMEYNAQGQWLKAQGPDGAQLRWQYDLLGRLVATTDAAQRTTRLRYAHEETNLPSLIEDARGDKLLLHWSAEDLLAAIATANAEEDICHIEHDRWGQIVQMQMQMQSAGAPTIRNRWDGHGRRVARTAGTQAATTWQHNPAGDLVCLHEMEEIALLAEHDTHGRIISQQVAGMRITYEYDAAGRLITMSGKKGGRLHFNYDAMNRITELTYADGRSKSFRYNAAGELINPRSALPKSSNGHERHQPQRDETLTP